ncbi:MAG: DUF928 domain-containing protein [Nitrospirae bacterium]|nr:DUF928 domain-containing protein [Nitrospirota bacterium]
MKKRKNSSSLIALIVVVALLGVISVIYASDESWGKGDEKPAKVGSLLVNYKPPLLGKPLSRIGGGTRGTWNNKLLLVALVPDHVGLSTNAQPSLCWFIGKATDMRVQLTLNSPESDKPILEKPMDVSEGGGVRCENLTADGITLEPDTEYQWYVSIVQDPQNRSKDITCSGHVKYAEPSKGVAYKLSFMKGAEAVAAYAGEGYWYDAIGLVSQLIEKAPADRTLHEIRAQLLDQAGLKNVSRFDRKLTVN